MNDHYLNGSAAMDVTDVQALQSSLITRSSRERGNLSRDQDLDSAVSAKIFHDIADVVDDVIDGASSAANTLKSAGMEVGTAIGNAAIVVGSHIIEEAKTTYDSLPGPIKNAASQLGEVAVRVGSLVQDAGAVVANAAVHLEGAVLHHAQESVQQGVKLSSKVGDLITDKETLLGGDVVKLGHLAAGLASGTWSSIKDAVSCWSDATSLCLLLLSDQCDCSASSHVTVSLDGVSLRCVFSKTSKFSKGYVFTPDSSKKASADKAGSGKLTLPGRDFVQAHKQRGQVLKPRVALKTKKSLFPSGSCESSLELAFEGAVQFEPDIAVNVKFNGDAEFNIKGLVRASIDALATAQGGCALRAGKKFPTKPIRKVICVKMFCLLIFMQMKAEVEMVGVLTGTVEVGASVDFDIEGTVTVNAKGDADVSFSNPSITHEANIRQSHLNYFGNI